MKISSIIGFVKNYKMWFIGAVVLAASHAAVYGFGYTHATQRAATEQVEKAERRANTVVDAVVKREAKAQAERIEVRVRDIRREQQLAAQIDNLKTERDALKEILYANPDPDPGVYLRAGDVCLLDDAARGDSDAVSTQGVSGAACIDAGEEQASSDVTLREFVGVEIDIRLQYRELAARHDALVEWVDRELIKPQLQSPGDLDHSEDK